MPLSDYKTALVTGASSGIGEATVRALTKRGIAVRALARREDRLDKLADETGCTPIALDLRDRDAIYEGLAKLDVDILVGNAGVGRGFDGFLKASPDDIDTTLETNVQALNPCAARHCAGNGGATTGACGQYRLGCGPLSHQLCDLRRQQGSCASAKPKPPHRASRQWRARHGNLSGQGGNGVLSRIDR